MRRKLYPAFTTFTAFIAVASAAALACGDNNGIVQPTPDSLSGPWTRLDEVPGSSERWILSVTDTVVTGTGTWTGEACCSGTLTASGYISRDSLHLEVTLTVTGGVPRPAIHERFDGVLQTPTLLVGTASTDGFALGTARLKKGTSAFD